MANMWSLSQKYQVAENLFAQEIIPASVLNILWNRGYCSTDEITGYLRPSLFDLHSPFLFKDMVKIMRRLEEALKLKQKILVYGDYDADGVTGTALLYKVLKLFGFDVLVHIPSREQGYGLHKEIIEKAAANNVTLIITVDCGITAIEEAIQAAGYDIDMIITDHHEPPEELPAALGILNPKVPDSGYPFKELAGVGVAFKLVQAIYKNFNCSLERFGSEREYLDLVALGTIADIVPLTGENRILVKYGLQEMENSNHAGIQALLAECGLNGKKLKAGQISFMVAPRINAAGRMDTARLALNLLLEDEYEEALEIARELNRENYQRQLTERKILQEAESNLSGHVPDVIVLSSPDWHHGVIGIVASRLVERFRRPVYLIAEEGEIGKGSARGIPNYHVLDELIKQDTLLLKYGGHKQAAGFSLPISNIEAFRTGLNKSFKDSGLIYQEKYEIDSVLPCEEICLNLQRELEQMAPFGAGNPAPLLMTSNMVIKRVTPIGKEGEHLRLILQAGDSILEALAFKRGKDLEQLKAINNIDIIYSLEINDYHGEEKIQAILKDYREAGGDNMSEVACTEEKTEQSPEPDSNAQIKTKVTRQIMVDFYKELREKETVSEAVYWQPNNKQQLQLIKIFEELGLVSWYGGTDPYVIKLNEEKTDLTKSLRFHLTNLA